MQAARFGRSANAIIEPVEERKWVFKTPNRTQHSISRVLRHVQASGARRVGFLSVNNAYGEAGRAEMEEAAPACGGSITDRATPLRVAYRARRSPSTETKGCDEGFPGCRTAYQALRSYSRGAPVSDQRSMPPEPRCMKTSAGSAPRRQGRSCRAAKASEVGESQPGTLMPPGS
jgi:hypothetical protein